MVALLLIGAKMQAQTNNNLVDCFRILFSKSNFEIPFYSRRPHEEVSCFFALRDSISSRLVEGNFFEKPQDLGSEIFFSVQDKNYLFAWGIEYYLRFTQFSISESCIQLTFEEINLFGFTEKVIRKREFVFIKKSNWILQREKVL